MVSKAVLAAIILLVSPVRSVAGGTCDVPSGMTIREKLPCVSASTVLLEQPSLTIEQLAKGPDFDAADPVKSRFAYFTPEDTITCYFRPFFAFLPDKGRTPKFLCWQLDSSGRFFDLAGQTIELDDAKVVAGKGGRGALYARSDTANAHEIKADLFKIKYLTPTVSEPRPPRQRSVHGGGRGPVSLGSRLSSRSHVLRAGGQVHRVQRRSVQGQPG